MSDEKRLELMEKFKNNELSENEVLNQVLYVVVVVVVAATAINVHAVTLDVQVCAHSCCHACTPAQSSSLFEDHLCAYILM